MTHHTCISAEEAADRLAIRDLVDAYAFRADRVYIAGEGTDPTDDLRGRLTRGTATCAEWPHPHAREPERA
jgi:hypothetical protein